MRCRDRWRDKLKTQKLKLLVVPFVVGAKEREAARPSHGRRGQDLVPEASDVSTEYPRGSRGVAATRLRRVRAEKVRVQDQIRIQRTLDRGHEVDGGGRFV